MKKIIDISIKDKPKIMSILDEFFGIDPIQLEKERREILENFVERVKNK